MLLIHFLREQLALTGPHIGCDTGHCGACTVDLNGKSVKSCMVFAAQANGAEVLDDRGPGRGRRHAASAAGGVSRASRAAVRLLHARHDHPRLAAAAGEPGPERRGDPLRHLRQSLPLHRLSEHRQGDPRRRGPAERAEGGRGMNAPTPSSSERTAKLEGLGCAQQARRGRPLHPGQGPLRRRHQAAGHAVRRLRPLALRPCADQADRQGGGAQGAGRQGDPDRRRPEAAQSPLHADARRRRAGGAGRREGAVPEPGGRLRHRERPLRRGRCGRAGRGRLRGRCRRWSIRSRRSSRTRRCCARTSRTRRTARTARAGTPTTSSSGRRATRRRPSRRWPRPRWSRRS